MQMTLHWANEYVVHAIDLDSLVDHRDHSRVHDGVFVRNRSVYGTGIGMSGLFVKAVEVNKMFMVMNNEYIRTNYTGVCM